MKEVVLILVALIALTAAALGFYYYRRRRGSPLWLYREAFQQHLRSIPISELDRYPGIGPGTVDRVRSGGARTLADLLNFPFERLPGIGPVKGHDLRLAVRSLEREARSRFDAGACPEAQEYRRKLDSLNTNRREVVDRDAMPPGAKPPEVRVPAGTPAVAQSAGGPSAAGPAVDLFRLSADPPGSGVEPPGLAKLRAYVRFGFLVARADGRVAQAEKKVLRHFLGEQFGHDATLLRHIDPVLEAIEKASTEETAVLAELRGASAEELKKLFALAGRLAEASGERNAREEALLGRIASSFGLALAPPPSASPDPGTIDPRTVLEVPAEAALSPELIRRRYTLLAEKLDPGRAAALGPEFAAMAERKRAELRRAAEALLAPLGVPLELPVAPPAPAELRHNPDLDDVFGG